MALVVALGCDSDDDDDDEDDDAQDDDTQDDDTQDDDDSASGPWSAGWPVEITVDGQALIEGSWDGEGPVWWVIDTGAARTYADADLTGTTNFATGDLVIGPLEFLETQVSCTELDEAEAFIGWDLAGLAGQDIFVERFIAVDYRAPAAHFFTEVPAESPPGVVGEAPAVTPYEVPGGIPVAPVRAGGAQEIDVDLIADTGSGVTILLEEFFDAIDDGTLPRLEGYIWGTNYGTDEGFVTRIPTLTVGSDPTLTVAGSWAIVIPTDNHLWPLLEGVGIEADGFLGYPFYRELVVGVDGIASNYLWWELDSVEHIDPQEWTRVGIEPSWRDDGFDVEMVFSPSDAATQGLLPGDRILEVDGDDLSTATLDDLKHMLRGDVGTTVAIRVGRDENEIQLDVEIEDLLPPL